MLYSVAAMSLFVVAYDIDHQKRYIKDQQTHSAWYSELYIDYSCGDIIEVCHLCDISPVGVAL